MEKRSRFFESLLSSKADQFSGLIEKGLTHGESLLKAAVEEPSETAAEVTREVPEMILAEDNFDIGKQMEGGLGEMAENSPYSRGVAGRDVLSKSVFKNESDDIPTASAKHIFGQKPKSLSPAREIMKRKLNHFEIEKLTEIIKDRLIKELKIHKERLGEEP